MQKMQIVQVAVSELKPAVYNPRTWSEDQIKHLSASLEKFQMVEPLIVNSADNRKNIVIGGHFRLEIAKRLGMQKVPVVYVNLPNLEDEQELNLRLNKNTGSFDFDLLKDFGEEFLLEVGFEDLEIENIFAEELQISEDNFEVKNELEKITKPQIKTGDLVELGKHKLICGDSTDPEILAKLLGDEKIDMIYTDPPYNIGYDYKNGLSEGQKYACEGVEDNKSLEEYRKFLEKTLENALPHLAQNAHLFYYCDQNYVGIVQEMYRKFGMRNKRTCLWIKNNQNVTPQTAFNKCYEPCVYAVKNSPYLSANHQNFTEISNGNVGNGNQTIEDISEMLDLWLAKRLPTSEYLHPTQKPLELHEKPLRRCTRLGDNILDFFGGSGSTLIACEKLGRRCFMLEKDPAFCDVIVKRFNQIKNEATRKKNY